MDSNYQKFADGFLNAYSWPERKEGPPIELLDVLDADERSRAEDVLIARLSSWRDDWPIIGLGHLRSKKSLPFLKKILRNARGSMKAHIATAIWKISSDPKMLDVVIRCSYPSIFSRLYPFKTFSQIDIIYCLAEFNNARAVNRLKELQNDTDYLVSYNAKRALNQIKASNSNFDNTEM